MHNNTMRNKKATIKREKNKRFLLPYLQYFDTALRGIVFFRGDD